jgi:hypothetical protein
MAPASEGGRYKSHTTPRAQAGMPVPHVEDLYIGLGN